MANRVMLSNSIWGLEKPALLPPNHILTGPLFKKDRSKALNDLRIKDPDLFKWMNDANERNIKIVYISIGSMCIWQKWSVEALYHGLKKLGVKVIWSLKTPELLPVQNDPDFYVHSWLP
mmetsp:Transcript_237/g.428  ORF Transcript_237/g.428 Transcript_237/m.428 type:complete len:119 (-) Transcript_237:106-462(-)